MTQILSGLAGALILAAALGIVVMARMIGSGAKRLTKALEGVGELASSHKAMRAGLADVSLQLKKLSGELEFLRTAMIGGMPEAGQDAPESPAAPPRPRGGPLPPFPSWQPFVAATDVPDAVEADTQVVDTTDEELVEIEEIESIRGKGFAAGEEADPTSNPPGITVDSK